LSNQFLVDNGVATASALGWTVIGWKQLASCVVCRCAIHWTTVRHGPTTDPDDSSSNQRRLSH